MDIIDRTLAMTDLVDRVRTILAIDAASGDADDLHTAAVIPREILNQILIVTAVGLEAIEIRRMEKGGIVYDPTDALLTTISVAISEAKGIAKFDTSEKKCTFAKGVEAGLRCAMSLIMSPDPTRTYHGIGFGGQTDCAEREHSRRVNVRRKGKSTTETSGEQPDASDTRSTTENG